MATALVLSGCAPESFGTSADSFAFPGLARAYIPLESSGILGTRDGAAVVIAPGVAVTNAHNANIVDTDAVLGTAPGYDLLYFRTGRTDTIAMGSASNGEEVIAYGQGSGGGLRVARGVISKQWPAAFGFVCDAGPGFSGGPVLDARTGKLIGITYGFEGDVRATHRLMIAYRIEFVQSQYRAAH